MLYQILFPLILVAFWSLTDASVKCPDPSLSCPDGMTCCKLPSGGYGCCPMPNAVCCADKIHCCPHATRCDLSTAQCLKQNGDAIPWNEKLVAELDERDTTCPDETSCVGDQSCCELKDGSYACCPHKNAVCCSDRLHCCPHSSQCDVKHGTCLFSNDFDDSTYEVFWHKMHTQNKVEKEEDLLSCPDGAKCPADTTCCPVDTFRHHYSCCPLKHGTCCSNIAVPKVTDVLVTRAIKLLHLVAIIIIITQNNKNILINDTVLFDIYASVLYINKF